MFDLEHAGGSTVEVTFPVLTKYLNATRCKKSLPRIMICMNCGIQYPNVRTKMDFSHPNACLIYSRLSKHPFFTESVYNWSHIDEAPVKQEKPLYQSKYSPSVKSFYESKKSPIPKTMGYCQTPLKSPQDYLKKHSGEKKVSKESKSVTCLCREKRCSRGSDDHISSDVTPILLKQSERNFVHENSLLAQRRPATAPEQRIIDDRKGHSFNITNSGWVPKYTNKEDYGRKPKYIEDIEKNLEESRARFRDFLFSEKMMTMPQRVTDEMKEEIFEGLVKNWKELIERYLKLPIKTETPLQLKRKLEIEKRINSLEKDIDYLVRNKTIFVGKGKYNKKQSYKF